MDIFETMTLYIATQIMLLVIYSDQSQFCS